MTVKALVACEFSGIVRNALLRVGIDAWSCDILPSEDASNRHIRDDVRNVLNDGWDLLIVAHPPCTRLCNSGVRWLTKPPEGRSRDDMWRELDEGALLFSDLWNAPVDHICVENPVMHKHAKERITNYQDFAQSVQPWQFGEPQFKRTCFWLKNLPPLNDTVRLEPPKAGTDAHKTWSRVHRMSKSADRAKERSRFFPGIADAMADQWGRMLLDRVRLAA